MSEPLNGHAFAQRWIADWNARNIDAVLDHYEEDCVFVSPKAAAITGAGEVRGRQALRAYWEKALSLNTSLHFSFRRAVWDANARTVAIVYEARLNDNPATLACEMLTFGDTGRAVRGEAFYGAAV